MATSLQQLNSSDQEQLTELAKANEIWKTSATTSSSNSLTGNQSGDLQFLMGHYTESDLRRLIGVAKSLDAFKRLDQHDQERLLKGWNIYHLIYFWVFKVVLIVFLFFVQFLMLK